VLDIDSYLYEATYDLILTCRNLPIEIQLRELVTYIVFLMMSLRITKMKINTPKLYHHAFRHDNVYRIVYFVRMQID